MTNGTISIKLLCSERHLARELIIPERLYSMRGSTLIIPRNSFWNSPWPRKMVYMYIYIRVHRFHAASTCTDDSVYVRACVRVVCVCAHSFATRYFAKTSRPTTWFNSHAFLLCSPSVSALFGPGFFLFPLPSLSSSSSRSPSSPVLSLLSWHSHEGQTRIGEIHAKPWPTERKRLRMAAALWQY